jgi:hypothetical protein
MSDNIIVHPKDLTRLGVSSKYNYHSHYNIIKSFFNKKEKRTKLTIFEVAEYYKIDIHLVIYVVNNNGCIGEKEHYLINKV